MQEQINRIVALFSEADCGNASTKETWDEYECKADIALSKIPDTQSLLRSIPEISGRDLWRITIATNGGDSILDIQKESGNIGDIKNDLEPYKEEYICFKFAIEKRKVDNNTLLILM